MSGIMPGIYHIHIYTSAVASGQNRSTVHHIKLYEKKNLGNCITSLRFFFWFTLRISWQDY